LSTNISVTDAQRAGSARLIAWISARCGKTSTLPLSPHKEFFATALPANLGADIPHLKSMANELLGAV
jgi:hypothetical protein